jgi:hypothetical protein
VGIMSSKGRGQSRRTMKWYWMDLLTREPVGRTLLTRWAGEDPEVRRQGEWERQQTNQHGGREVEVRVEAEETAGPVQETTGPGTSGVEAVAPTGAGGGHEEWLASIVLFLQPLAHVRGGPAWAELVSGGSRGAQGHPLSHAVFVVGVQRAMSPAGTPVMQLPVLREHLGWLALRGSQGTRWEEFLDEARAVLQRLLQLAHGLELPRGEDENELARAVFEVFPGFLNVQVCPRGGLAAGFNDVLTAVVGATQDVAASEMRRRLVSQLMAPEGQEQITEVRQLVAAAQARLMQLSRGNGAGSRGEAARELRAAQELLQSLRAREADSPEPERCVICSAPPPDQRAERCSAGCSATFCAPCLQQVISVVPVADCFRCRTLGFGGWSSGLHTPEIDLGGMGIPPERGQPRIVDNHAFILHNTGGDTALTQDWALRGCCPCCRRPFTDEQIDRVGGRDWPPFEVGDVDAERVMEEAIGTACRLTYVGAVDADLMQTQGGRERSVFVTVAPEAGLEGATAGNGDVVCRMRNGPPRLTVHREVRAGRQGLLRVQVIHPGGQTAVVAWQRVSFHHFEAGTGRPQRTEYQARLAFRQTQAREGRRRRRNAARARRATSPTLQQGEQRQQPEPAVEGARESPPAWRPDEQEGAPVAAPVPEGHQGAAVNGAGPSPPLAGTMETRTGVGEGGQEGGDGPAGSPPEEPPQGGQGVAGGPGGQPPEVPPQGGQGGGGVPGRTPSPPPQGGNNPDGSPPVGGEGVSLVDASLGCWVWLRGLPKEAFACRPPLLQSKFTEDRRFGALLDDGLKLAAERAQMVDVHADVDAQRLVYLLPALLMAKHRPGEEADAVAVNSAIETGPPPVR